jgi:drug/metabolite transporter (DMT)-like permease
MNRRDETTDLPEWHRYIGVGLALMSGLLIGSSFIIKKLALLEVDAKNDNGHAYLTSWKWWLGLLTMAFGEAANFIAFSFAPAVLITPLGAVSVVTAAILSSYILKERLSFGGKIGCFQCVVGATILVLFAPHEGNLTQTAAEFWQYAFHPVFVSYFCFCVIASLVLTFYCVPRFAQKNVLVYITLCSIGGSFLVLFTQGFGSALVYSIANPQNQQFASPGFWVLAVGVILGCIYQIYWLNLALATFNTAVVTPVYYVLFTTMTMVSSCFLFRRFAAEGGAPEIIATLLGVAVIASGVALLYDFNRDLLKQTDEFTKMDELESPTTAVESQVTLTVPDVEPVTKLDIPMVTTPSATSLQITHRNRTVTGGLPVPGVFGSFRLPSPYHPRSPALSRHESRQETVPGSMQGGLTLPISRSTSRSLDKSESVIIH